MGDQTIQQQGTEIKEKAATAMAQQADVKFENLEMLNQKDEKELVLIMSNHAPGSPFYKLADYVLQRRLVQMQIDASLLASTKSDHRTIYGIIIGGVLTFIATYLGKKFF